MPRRHKNKYHARGKRHHVRGDTQEAQASAAAAPGEECPSSPSSAPQGSPPSSPAAGDQQELLRAVAPSSPGAEASCAGSDEGASQDEEDSRSSDVSSSTENTYSDTLNSMTSLLEQFLLYKMKQPMMKEDMLKLIHPRYHDRFAEILKRASEHIEAVFAVDLKEVDSTIHSYDLVSKLNLPNNGRVWDGRGLPKTGLLMTVLGVIFLKGDCATEEDIWKFLNTMQVYAGRERFIYGEPRKLITKDLVTMKYPEYRQVANSDPPRYEFLWGPRAHAETRKMKGLEFLAKANDTVPSTFSSQYEEALRDEERARKWDLRSGQGRQLLYFVDNKTICEESTGQINVGFRYSTSKESQQNLYPG
uniref:MAGE domain-containing protein n=1 Tax=Moschus moschiferus TaxID=68415 RepID=A0A8C6D3N3_MOSMO